MARGSRRWWGQTQEVTKEGGHGLVSCLPGSFWDGEELMSALAELQHVQREHGGGAFWGLSSLHLWPVSWKVLECQSCLQGENTQEAQAASWEAVGSWTEKQLLGGLQPWTEASHQPDAQHGGGTANRHSAQCSRTPADSSLRIPAQ